MLHKKGEVPKYKGDFLEGEAAGFRVTGMRHKLHDDSSGRKTEMIHVEMETPYTYAGEKVTAFAVVDPRYGTANGVFMSDRPCSEVVLVLPSNGKDLADVAQRENGTRAYVVMDGDGPLAGVKATEAVGRFASAASHYPSVMEYDEYKEVLDNNLKANRGAELGIKATPDGYLRYLDHTKAIMEKEHVRFVGKVTTPRQVDCLREGFESGRTYDEVAMESEDMRQIGE